MSPRRIRAASLTRLLGAWRSDQSGPAYRQLADGLRLLILDGRLPLDVVLPGERELAAALEVSRTTVTGAFARLREQGFLQSRQGAGARTRLPTGPGQRDAGPLIRPSEPGVIDLIVAAMPAGEFVHQAYAKAIEALPAHLPHHGYEPVGLPVLREAIADRYTRRGLPTAPDQVLVTHGAQHAWALMLRLLTGPGDRVVIDHPTYPNAIDAILRASCRPVPVSLPPGEGWDVEGVVAAFQQSAPRLAHLVPDFHNPTGRWMDFAAREAIAAAGARTRTVVVFDETMLDLALDGLRASYGFAEPPGSVVRLGSTGKSFWGGLRIGWIRAEPDMIAALGRMRASIDLGTPVLEQLAAAALLQDDEAALAARRADLRARRDLLVKLAAERLTDWRVSPPPGGLSVWAELPAPVSNALAATCERHGVRIAAGPRFGVDGAFERFVRLPFTLPSEPMSEAIDRLAAAYGRLRPQAAHPAEPVARAVV